MCYLESYCPYLCLTVAQQTGTQCTLDTLVYAVNLEDRHKDIVLGRDDVCKLFLLQMCIFLFLIFFNFAWELKVLSSFFLQIYVGEGRVVSRNEVKQIENKYILFSQRAEQIFEIVRGQLHEYRITNKEGYKAFIEVDIQAVKRK